ncbi:MAG: TolC family protein [Pseudomonadota bacterium]
MTGRVTSRLASLAVAALATAAPVYADCLAFADALSLASSNDPSVRVARANLDNAEAGLQQARSLRRPQLAAFGRTGIGDNGLVDSQIENQIGVRLSQRVIDFGDSSLARKAARSDIAAQENFVLDAKAAAALDAGLSYIAWQEALAQLRATEERVSYFSQQLEAIESLLVQGGATRLEQAEVAAEKASAEAIRFEFEFRRDRAATEVALATGDAGALCDNARLQVSNRASAESPEDLQDLVASAVRQNPGLEALRRTSDGLDASAKRQARERLPIIDVVGIASYASEDFDGGFDLQTRVGVNVSVPILTGSALTARRRQASAQAARARGELAVARRNLQEDIQVTHRRTLLLEAQNARQADVARLKTAQFDAAKIEYEQGLRTLPRLIEIRLELEQASLNSIATEFNLARERLRLAALTGQILQAPNDS